MPIYMKIEGVTGTGTGQYFGWIELLTCQLVSNLRHPNEGVAQKYTDIASGFLLQIWKGQRDLGKKVIVHYVHSESPIDVLKLELENPELENLVVASGGDFEGHPVENWTFSYSKAQPIGPRPK